MHHINCNGNYFLEPRERTTLSNEPLCVRSTETVPPPQCLEVIYARGIIKQCLIVRIILGHFGCKLAVYALCNKTMVPWSPLDSFSCHNVHDCIFSIDSLKYVFESNFFH
ncbi:hypothetical protein DPMN_035553 [Dreissena polymorpha]|uniref:Uncharacterized protein n=1 Tax=Dreissena polymorpha TaxID=45954 RepID=A0A9D4RM25_DREPO|nr:hypothetical protein DPMN_035553 [Dreissena polymorpha]